MNKQIDRIIEMSKLYDEIIDDLNNHIINKDKINILIHYYDNDWQEDYDLDKQGLIPKNINREILCEDTLYNLFDDLDV